MAARLDPALAADRAREAAAAKTAAIERIGVLTSRVPPKVLGGGVGDGSRVEARRHARAVAGSPFSGERRAVARRGDDIGAVRMTKSRGINRPKWTPTPEQVERVRLEFPTTPTADLARAFGVGYHQVARLALRLGVHKADEYLAGAGGRLDGVRGMGTRFQPGHVPWTKGRRLGGLVPLSETAFKPGQRPHNYLPLGSLRVESGGYLQRKVTETGYPPRDWQFVHRLVWEQAHGPIPAGHRVVFRPGRRTADVEKITVDALELVSLRELMERNRMPPELQAVVQLRGVVTRVINQRSKA